MYCAILISHTAVGGSVDFGIVPHGASLIGQPVFLRDTIPGARLKKQRETAAPGGVLLSLWMSLSLFETDLPDL